jgi:hypothetical protein
MILPGWLDNYPWNGEEGPLAVCLKGCEVEEITEW